SKARDRWKISGVLHLTRELRESPHRRSEWFDCRDRLRGALRHPEDPSGATVNHWPILALRLPGKSSRSASQSHDSITGAKFASESGRAAAAAPDPPRYW